MKDSNTILTVISATKDENKCPWHCYSYWNELLTHRIVIADQMESSICILSHPNIKLLSHNTNTYSSLIVPFFCTYHQEQDTTTLVQHPPPKQLVTTRKTFSSRTFYMEPGITETPNIRSNLYHIKLIAMKDEAPLNQTICKSYARLCLISTSGAPCYGRLLYNVAFCDFNLIHPYSFQNNSWFHNQEDIQCWVRKIYKLSHKKIQA